MEWWSNGMMKEGAGCRRHRAVVLPTTQPGPLSLHQSISPLSLPHSNTPPLQYSLTPALPHSLTPTLQHEHTPQSRT
jgi:hypothetical protein